LLILLFKCCAPEKYHAATADAAYVYPAATADAAYVFLTLAVRLLRQLRLLI